MGDAEGEKHKSIKTKEIMLSRQSYRFGKQQIEQQSLDGFNQQKNKKWNDEQNLCCA